MNQDVFYPTCAEGIEKVRHEDFVFSVALLFRVCELGWRELEVKRLLGNSNFAVNEGRSNSKTGGAHLLEHLDVGGGFVRDGSGAFVWELATPQRRAAAARVLYVYLFI